MSPRQTRRTVRSGTLEGRRRGPAEGDGIRNDPRKMRAFGKDFGEGDGPGFQRNRAAGNLRGGRSHQFGTDGDALAVPLVGVVGSRCLDGLVCLGRPRQVMVVVVVIVGVLVIVAGMLVVVVVLVVGSIVAGALRVRGR